MTNYLCSVSPGLVGNYDLGVQNNVWGVVDTYKEKIGRVKTGDRLAFIVGGIFRSLHLVESTVKHNPTPLWPARDGDYYSWRIQISDPIAFSTKDARVIGEEIGFMHGRFWGGTIMGANGVFNPHLTDDELRFIFGDFGVDSELLEPTSSEEELQDRVRQLLMHGPRPRPKGRKAPKKAKSTTTEYYRLPEVVAYVLQEANGRCESCFNQAPFLRSDGTPFLEVHHVKPLAKGGSDKAENAVALCPNCHRACHYAEDRADKTDALYEAVHRLVREDD